MSTELAKARMTPARLLAEMAELSVRQLDRVIEGASRIRFERHKALLPARESELLRTVNRGLDAERQIRLDHLQAKLREEKITSRERAQLLRLTETLEKLAAERLEALIELAALRQTSVPKLMEELGLPESSHV